MIFYEFFTLHNTCRWPNQIGGLKNGRAQNILQRTEEQVPQDDEQRTVLPSSTHQQGVIIYLYDREICPEKYRAESNWYSTQKDKRTQPIECKEEPHEYNEKRLADIFAREMRDLPDLLTIADVVDFIGCYKAWCRSGKLKAFRISGRFLIPKEYFIQYLASPRMYYSALQTTYYKYIIAQYHQQCNPTTDACLDVPTEDAE